MSTGAGGANFEFFDYTDDVLGTEFFYTTILGEGEVVVLEPFHGAQGTGMSKLYLGISRRLVRGSI